MHLCGSRTSSLHGLWLLPGTLGHFGGILTRSDLFVGLCELFEVLCARVHLSDDVGHAMVSLLRAQPRYFCHGVGTARTFQLSSGCLSHLCRHAC